MKRFILQLVAILISLSTLSMTKFEAMEYLREQVALSKKQLPMHDVPFTLSLDISENNLIIHYKIDEEKINLDYLFDNIKLNKSIVTLAFNSSQDFVEAIIKSEYSLLCNFESQQTGITKQLFYTHEDLLQIFNVNSDSVAQIKQIISDYRQILPYYMGGGLTITSIDIDNGFVVYRVKTDETYLTIPFLELTKENDPGTIEKSLLDDYIETATSTQIVFINKIKEANMGLKYIYWSEKSVETVTFVISPQLINQYIKAEY